MRAVAVTEPDATPAVIELPRPQPGPGEVLVEVAASSVNGFDVSVAGGMLHGMMDHRYPVVLGKDVAGTVTAVGGDVTRFAPGDAVFGVVVKPFLGDGGFGEYVTVPADTGLTALPAGLDLPTAGVLGLAGTAAADTVAAADAGPDTTVLVVGATGGVGSVAVQLLAASGCTVLATGRTDEAAELLTRLGATHVIDHTDDLAGHVRAIAPDGVDAVVHLAGDPSPLLELLADGGRLVSALGFGADQHPAALAIMADPTATTLDRLAAEVVAGRLEVPVSRTYPLDQTPRALTDFTQGKLGKLALTLR